MKICIVSRALYPVIGGSETYAYNLGEYLSGRGHQVVVVTSDLPPHYGDEHSYPFEVARVAGLSEFNSARAPLSTLVPFHRLLRSLRPDVIHVQSVLPGIALTLIADTLPGPPAIVFTDHNTPMPEQRRWISGVNCYEVELAFGQFMFKHGTYDAALAPSRRFYDWAISRGAPPEKLHLIRHGVDVERFHPVSHHAESAGRSVPAVPRRCCSPRAGWSVGRASRGSWTRSPAPFSSPRTSTWPSRPPETLPSPGSSRKCAVGSMVRGSGTV